MAWGTRAQPGALLYYFCVPPLIDEASSRCFESRVRDEARINIKFVMLFRVMNPSLDRSGFTVSHPTGCVKC